MLDSDMKEVKDGVVWLEMFSEVVMVIILDFIYIGNVLIVILEIVEDLIVMVDYLFFLKFKIFVKGVVVNLKMFNVLNCILSYYFVEMY